MLYARISGIASYVPDDILDNEMLSKMVDTNDEWITTRVGIKQRRILKKEGAGSSYMGAKAVEKLLADTGTSPEEVELLICATSNPDYRFDNLCLTVWHKLSNRTLFAFPCKICTDNRRTFCHSIPLQNCNAILLKSVYIFGVKIGTTTANSLEISSKSSFCNHFFWHNSSSSL